MGRENEEYAHPELVGGGETTKHSHPGGNGGLSKHMDAGLHTIETSKAWEAESFDSTFGSVPIVVAGTQESGNVGKKMGVKDVTTTGFSVYCEATGVIGWHAREEGYE